MAIQWHPILAQFLENDYKEQILIKQSVKLGEMPLEMDMLIEPIVSIQLLPYPFNYLGETTLVEFKGPGDIAAWTSLAQIESYACIYMRNNEIADRRKLTLWVIASKFSENIDEPPYDCIDNLTHVGAGMRCGALARFPIYLIDLGELPITIPTIPLLMVYRGDLKREKEIVTFVIKHRLQLHEYIEFLSILHAKALKEVLGNMNIENLRELELDMPAITDIFDVMVRTIGPENALKEVLDNMNTENLRELELDMPAITDIFDVMVRTIGTEKVIEKIGLERIIQTVGIEKIEELIEKTKQAKVEETE
jgi:hypothetical protein